jgi:hypothetical protein
MGVGRWPVSRRTPYRIVLSAEQERRAGGYPVPWRDMVRAKTILLALKGESNAAIAERLGVARQSVSEWRKRFFDEGLACLAERARAGRPTSFPRRR